MNSCTCNYLFVNRLREYPSFLRDCYTTPVKGLSALRIYLVNNWHLVPNAGQHYRAGEPIATGFVESTVIEGMSKRFCNNQQMPWSKEGAHLLLQTRVRTLSGELAVVFKHWYVDLDMKAKEIPMAASSPASPCSLQTLPPAWWASWWASWKRAYRRPYCPPFKPVSPRPTRSRP